MARSRLFKYIFHLFDLKPLQIPTLLYRKLANVSIKSISILPVNSPALCQVSDDDQRVRVHATYQASFGCCCTDLAAHLKDKIVRIRSLDKYPSLCRKFSAFHHSTVSSPQRWMFNRRRFSLFPIKLKRLKQIPKR